ncbi:MAG: glycosyltransferase [Verrucomicrobiota bacterium]
MTGDHQPTLNICLATDSFAGPTPYSATAVHFRRHATMLRDAGHKVSLVLVRDHVSCDDETTWRGRLAEEGINFELLPPAPKHADIRASSRLHDSWRLVNWLHDHPFDIVHGSEQRGVLYYPLLARHQGLFEYPTQFIVSLLAPLRWRNRAEFEHVIDGGTLEQYFMEQRIVELADALVTPTSSVLDWTNDEHWSLPPLMEVIAPHWQSPAALPSSTTPQSNKKAPHHLVTLIDTSSTDPPELLAHIADALEDRGKENFIVTIVNFGNSTTATEFRLALKSEASENSRWLETLNIVRPASSGNDWTTLLNQDHPLVLFLSRATHTSETLNDCMEQNIPFLLNEAAPAIELIHPDHHDHIACSDVPETLISRILRWMDTGDHPSPAVRRNVTADDISAKWNNLFDQLADATPNPATNPPTHEPTPATQKSDTGSRPVVSVCMPHFNRPHFLELAIDSLRKQTSDQFELIVVDDGSTDPDALKYLDALAEECARRDWRLVRQANAGPSRARNVAAQMARGEFLLFMDDDNIAKPNEIETFIKVARHTGADVLNCVLQAFSGNESPPDNDEDADWIWLPLGPSPSMGALVNCFGDTNFLVRTDVFAELGGFTPDSLEERLEEDWDFLSRAMLAGKKMELVPHMLYWYRRIEGEGRAETGIRFQKERSGTLPYRHAVPDALFDLVLFAHGAARTIPQLSGRQQIRKLRREIKRCHKDLREVMRRADELSDQSDHILKTKRWHTINPLRLFTTYIYPRKKSTLVPREYSQAKDRYHEARERAQERFDQE